MSFQVFALLAALLLVATVTANPQCSRPKAPRYGYISGRSKSNYHIGSVVIIKCNRGYQLRGHRSITCSSRGNNAYWNVRVPICIKIVIIKTCGKLQDPKYGDVSLTGITIGSKAKYSCNRGFTLKGNSVRKCQNNGRWSGSQPSCKRINVVRCKKLSDPVYGDVKLTGVNIGSKAIYSCDRDFKLKGDRTRKCLSSGQWSGNAPVCKKIFVVTCQKLIDPVYGDVILTGVKIGSKAKYSCDRGFKLRGNRIRKCLSNGQWSGSDAVCERNPTCQSLIAPVYGSVKLTGVSVGSKATYSCDSGFKLRGDRTRKCLSNGQWSGSDAVCQAIPTRKCQYLSQPKYGFVHITGVQVGSTASYSCQKGYVIKGVSYLTCQQNGHWSSQPPVCVYLRYYDDNDQYDGGNGQYDDDEDYYYD